jgi:hypothetical protein
MNTEDLGNSKILNWLFKPAGVMIDQSAKDICFNYCTSFEIMTAASDRTLL